MRSDLKESLMSGRHPRSEKEADEEIKACKKDLQERLANNEMPFDICEEWFGLEPDYIFDLI